MTAKPKHTTATRAAVYARVSTTDQTTENQLTALRSFANARGWVATEYVDHGISGAKERRPALDAMITAARARKIDVVVATKLNRLARSTHQLINLGKELETLRVDLVITEQALDTTTPTGRLLFHVLAALAEFERELIRDRVVAGLRRAKAQGRRLGRPREHRIDAETARELLANGLSLRAVARQLGTHPYAVSRAVTNPSARPSGSRVKRGSGNGGRTRHKLQSIFSPAARSSAALGGTPWYGTATVGEK